MVHGPHPADLYSGALMLPAEPIGVINFLLLVPWPKELIELVIIKVGLPAPPDVKKVNLSWPATQ